MRIAVDASALSTPGNGIARYVRALLRRMLDAESADHDWLLYARSRSVAEGLGLDALGARRAQVRHDALPANVGRLLSLASSQPAWLLRDRPDLHWGPAHRLPLWLPRRTARVVTIHDLCWIKAADTMRRSTRWLDARLMPRALHAADRIIAVSTTTADDLRRTFPQAAERVVVVHEAADSLPAPAPISTLAALGVDAPYVLFVGTLEPRKNLPRLLQAFHRVTSDSATDVQLVLAGGVGWGDADLAALVRQLKLESRVRLIGMVDDARLATLYRHAQCLAMPSLYEGFGLPLLEALAQGTPVLTSNTASMPEVAGDAAVLVDPLSVESIAEGLGRMLGDPELRARLAAEAPRQAARFSWTRAAEETLRVFEEAVEARRARLT